MGEAGNTEPSGKLVGDMATPVGMTIVTVVAGDCGTFATSLKVSLEVVIVNPSHIQFVPVCVPVPFVLYTREWRYVLPTNLKVWDDDAGWDIS
jgi:hypothetical protein